MLPYPDMGERRKKMLVWSWDDRCGKVEDVNGNEVNLYACNALLMGLTESGDEYNLSFFFADEAHLKNMLGMNKRGGYTENCIADWGWKKMTLNPKKVTKVDKLVTLLLKGLPDLEIDLIPE